MKGCAEIEEAIAVGLAGSKGLAGIGMFGRRKRRKRLGLCRNPGPLCQSLECDHGLE